MVFNVIKIESNNYTIDDLNPVLIKQNELYDDINDIAKSIDNLTNDKLMETVINSLSMVTENVGHTTIISETHKELIQMCYLMVEKKNKTVNDKINGVGQILVKGLIEMDNPEYNKNIVIGTIIIMKISINNGKYENAKITNKDISEILYRKCVKRCIIIDPGLKQENHITEVNYVIEPIEFLQLNEKMNMKYFEFNALDYIVKLFIEIEPTQNIINNDLCLVFNKYIVKGRGLLCLQNSEGVFVDVSKETYDKLMIVLKYKKKKTIDQEALDKTKKNDILQHFYIVLNNEYMKLKNYNNDNNNDNYNSENKLCLNDIIKSNIKNE